MTYRKVLVFALLYFLALFLFVGVVHEGGHFIAALLSGIPLNEIQIGFHGINLAIGIPDKLTAGNLTFYYLAGGLTPAIILILVYLLYWYRTYRRSPSLLRWLLGGTTIFAAGVEIANGYVEASFHAIYMYDADSVFNTIGIIYVLGVLGATLVHFIVFPRPKEVVLDIVRLFVPDS